MPRPFGPPAKWLRQARADLRAATADGEDFAECHRRYFLQQAYEKGLKAYCISRVPGGASNVQCLVIRDTILRSHSPLNGNEMNDQENDEALKEHLQGEYPDEWARALRAYKLVRREAHDLMRRLRRGETLRAIDATFQTIRATEVSYRYPFYREHTPFAPSEWDGWTDYQGPYEDVVSAVEELLERVGVDVGIGSRRR